MTPEGLFGVLNALVLPWWAAWLLAPRSRPARRLASHGAVFAGLGAAYLAFLATALASGPPGSLDFDGLRTTLSGDWGFLAGWTHYLCFDLFIGAWIVRDAARLSLEPRPYLVFALLAGPIGLAGFLLRRAVRLRSFGAIGESDLA